MYFSNLKESLCQFNAAFVFPSELVISDFRLEKAIENAP